MYWIIEKAREFHKNIYFCFFDNTEAFDCVDDNNLWEILKEMGIPDHLTCLLRNLYTGQEATESYMEQLNGSKFGKEYDKTVYCHPVYLISMQTWSVTQSRPTLCDPMDCSMPGFPVFHYLPEFVQTHILWVSDAIQPSHPLSPLSPPAFNLSQHQDLF